MTRMSGSALKTEGRRGSQRRGQEGGRYLGIPPWGHFEHHTETEIGHPITPRSLSVSKKPGAIQDGLGPAGGWIADYNTQAPHSALGMRSPADYRAEITLSSSR